jgi:predicted membrane chloride channel (bestrophin family)
MPVPQHQDPGYSRTVSYTNRNHLSVIFQRWGSVNGKVMPFCLVNVALTLFLMWLLENGTDMTVSAFGHELMSILVSFLVINKLSFALSLYYELLGYLSKMNQSCVELTQLACSFTSGYHHEEHKAWRFNVALQVLTLLKTTVFVMYQGGSEKVYEFPELADNPLLLNLPWENDIGHPTTVRNRGRGAFHRVEQIPKELYTFSCHLQSDKNLRTPIRVAQRLREAITSHRQLKEDPIDGIREQQLLNCAKEFMDNYHGVRKYLVCPLPLPLAQLGRIFVIFYTFTLPFAVLSPELDINYFTSIIIVVLMSKWEKGFDVPCPVMPFGTLY